MLTKFHRDDLSVVVVEDDGATRALLTRLLLKMGALSVDSAADGAEGLKLVCQKRPSLVVCDLEMEPVDGLSLLGGIRAALDPMLADTPVFFFTGNNDDAVLAKAKALQVSGYLVKPFNPRGFAKYMVEAMAARIKATPQPRGEEVPPV